MLWDGSASGRSAKDTFGILNCVAPGSITAATDPTRGRVWRMDKPAASNRCEAHGIRVNGAMYAFSNNSTYYLDWSAKLTSIVNNNAIFQWKSYGDHIQNYPLVLKIISGRLTLLNRQPDNKVSYPWAKDHSRQHLDPHYAGHSHVRRPHQRVG